ncbi:hypothetical protein [Streptomyces sp. NPDC054784]
MALDAMCKDFDNDSDYSKGGACTGTDDNRTNSAVNLGWNTTNDAVRFYDKTDYRVRLGCLKRGKYLNDAGGDSNKTWSHRWTAGC